MQGLTVFVLSDSDHSSAVRTLVESWTRSGILEPSLWVSSKDVREAPSGPPSVQATHVHEQGTDDVDLFEHLGRFRLEIVRVVAAHLVLQGSATDTELINAGHVVASAVELVLPRRVGAAAGGPGNARLHRSLVVIPVSGADSIDRTILEPDWDVNVVISPEDRPDLDRASIFVRHPGNFHGHAAAAVAALGGILRGVGSGALDEMIAGTSGEGADALVARTSIRTIVGEDVIDRIADRAVETVQFGSAGPSSVLPWARPASQPQMVAEQAARHLLDHSAWAPGKPPVFTAPQKGHQTFLQALGTAAKFNVRASVAVVTWTLMRGRSRFERRATEAIVGSEAGALVTLGPRPASDFESASRKLIEREQQRIDDEMRLQATRMGAIPAETWTSMRDLAFSLADGGPLGNFPEPRQAGKRELLPPSAIVVPPGDVWRGLEKQELSADDPRTMRRYLKWVKSWVAHTDSLLKKTQEELSSAEEGLKSLDGSPDAKAVREATTLVQTKAAAVEAAARKAGIYKAEAEAYTAWHDAKAASVLWQLGDDIGQRSDDLDELAERVSAPEAADAPPVDALKRSQRRLHRLWGWITGAFLVLAAAVVYARFGPLPTAWTWAPITLERMIHTLLVLFGVVVVVLTSANHSFYKALRRYEWAVEQLLAKLRSRTSQYVYVGQERTRLTLLYDALRDWVGILGELLHKPWTEQSASFEDLPDEVVNALPASMGAARQSTSHDAIPQTVMIDAYQVVYPRGWARRQFDAAHDAWEGQHGVGSEEGYRAVDLDTMDSVLSPRRRLRVYWSSGAAQEVSTKRARDDLKSAVREGALLLPMRVVRRLGRYGDGTDLPETDFYSATVTENTTFATDLFSPSARLARRHYVDRSLVWLPKTARGDARDEEIEVRPCEGPTALRVDISRKLSVDELTVFAPAPSPVPSEDAPGVSSSSKDELPSGTIWV